MPITRHGVRLALGGLWVLDGLLQLQPAMFTPDFAHEVLAPAGEGQPWFVSAPIELEVRVIAAQPVAWGVLFAVVQIALGVGLLLPRLARPAIVASLLWSMGVWWLGEGLGGLAGGHADILMGAPGAVLLYAVLAVAAWPPDGGRPNSRTSLPGWLAVAWAIFWVGGAVLRVLPGQGRSATIAAELNTMADGAPDWLAHVQTSVAATVLDWGTGLIVAFVLVCLVIGLGGLRPGRTRTVAVGVGIAVTLPFWVLGQSLGMPWSGLMTDPSTGPLVVLMALGLIGITDPPPGPTRRWPHRGRTAAAGSGHGVEVTETAAVVVSAPYVSPAALRVVYHPRPRTTVAEHVDTSPSGFVDDGVGGVQHR